MNDYQTMIENIKARYSIDDIDIQNFRRIHNQYLAANVLVPAFEEFIDAFMLMYLKLDSNINLTMAQVFQRMGFSLPSL